MDSFLLHLVKLLRMHKMLPTFLLKPKKIKISFMQHQVERLDTQMMTTVNCATEGLSDAQPYNILVLKPAVS